MKGKKSAAIGFPRPRSVHQSLVAYFCYELIQAVRGRELWVLPEASLTSNLNDVSPDILVCTKEHAPLLIVEFTNRHDAYRVRKKIRERILPRFPEIEAFMFNYETEVWESNMVDAPTATYSLLLDMDLSNIVLNANLFDSQEKEEVEKPVHRPGIGNVM